MSGIVWLASYPKSGNTWLRALLTNMLHNADEPADINHLVGVPMASSRSRFDEWAGIEASALDPDVVDRLRPEVYRRMARDAGTLFVKVHDAWTYVEAGEPMFPRDVTQGVIYIVRNPLTVAVSCAHHWGVTIEAAVDRLCDGSAVISAAPAARHRPASGASTKPPGGSPAASTAITPGLPAQLPQQIRSWSDHVRSWVDDSSGPVHVVRYEDLTADTRAAASAVARFCGLQNDEDQVARAVTFSSFGELRRQEMAHGFAEQSMAAPGGFFWHGQTGCPNGELTEDLAGRLSAAHHEMMKRFGYAP